MSRKSNTQILWICTQVDLLSTTGNEMIINNLINSNNSMRLLPLAGLFYSLILQLWDNVLHHVTRVSQQHRPLLLSQSQSSRSVWTFLSLSRRTHGHATEQRPPACLEELLGNSVTSCRVKCMLPVS